MKAIQAFVATLFFVVALLAAYTIHVRWFEVNVVLYSAIEDACIATALLSLLLLLWRGFAAFSGLEKAQLILIWLLLGYIFAISIPTVIDRSLSFYILEKLQQRGGGIQLSRINDVFTQEYLPEHHLMDVRMTEQVESGTVTIRNGCVQLTERGRELAQFSRYFRQNFLPKHRLIMGTYTDALTDPFRHSVATPDYTCGSGKD
jgi:hypothetical protein